MFAVIQTGGKQYKVAKGTQIQVEKLEGVVGSSLTLDKVLLVNDGKKTITGNAVQGASVSATIVEEKRTDKVIIFKKKRRHNYRRKKGHRQEVMILEVSDISTKKAATKE